MEERLSLVVRLLDGEPMTAATARQTAFCRWTDGVSLMKPRATNAVLIQPETIKAQTERPYADMVR